MAEEEHEEAVREEGLEAAVACRRKAVREMSSEVDG